MLKIRNIIITLYYSLYYVVAIIFNRNDIFHDLDFGNEQIGLNENLAMHISLSCIKNFILISTKRTQVVNCNIEDFLSSNVGGEYMQNQ